MTQAIQTSDSSPLEVVPFAGQLPKVFRTLWAKSIPGVTPLTPVWLSDVSWLISTIVFYWRKTFSHICSSPIPLPPAQIVEVPFTLTRQRPMFVEMQVRVANCAPSAVCSLVSSGSIYYSERLSSPSPFS